MVLVGYSRVPAGRLVVERSRRQSRGPARHQTARRHRDRIAAPKKRPCARWIRMPDRGSLWLLPSGPDQIRNMSSSEPIERARRSVYLTCSRPPRQVGRTHRMDSPHSSISLAAPAVQDRAARGGQRAGAGHDRERGRRQAAVAGVGHAALGAVAASAAAGAVI